MAEVFRCGAPLGTFAGQQPEGSYVSGDMGHIIPTPTIS